MKKKYSFKEGFFGAAINPEDAAKELERIRKTRNGLTAGTVVDEARPADAVLHPQFEWDDGVAAEEYRRDQARRLIRAVVVVIDKEEPRRVYASVKVPEVSGPATYERIDIVVQNVDRYAIALRNLQREVAEAQSSLHELVHMAETQGDDPERMTRLTIALEAAAAFRSSIESIH